MVIDRIQYIGNRMNKFKFLRESIKNLKTVGTVTPSSRFLCEAMLKGIDFSEATLIIELGGGNGVLTQHILKKMRPDARLLTFEVQANFCELLRKIDDDRLVVIEDSAEFLPKYLEQYGRKDADHIISAIPFVILPKPLAKSIVSTCRDHLAPDGRFAQLHYSTILRSMYEEVFPVTKVNFTPLNLPPAFVFHCSK